METAAVMKQKALLTVLLVNEKGAKRSLPIESEKFDQ